MKSCIRFSLLFLPLVLPVTVWACCRGAIGLAAQEGLRSPWGSTLPTNGKALLMTGFVRAPGDWEDLALWAEIGMRRTDNFFAGDTSLLAAIGPALAMRGDALYLTLMPAGLAYFSDPTDKDIDVLGRRNRESRFEIESRAAFGMCGAKFCGGFFYSHYSNGGIGKGPNVGRDYLGFEISIPFGNKVP